MLPMSIFQLPRQNYIIDTETEESTNTKMITFYLLQKDFFDNHIGWLEEWTSTSAVVNYVVPRWKTYIPH